MGITKAPVHFSVVVAVLSLCACNGSMPSSSPPNSVAPGVNAGSAARGHTGPYRRWIAPDVSSAPRLFFATDVTNGTVEIYSMPSMQLRGQLAGFNTPFGECETEHGHIWVADYGARALYKFSRTGVQLEKLRDAYGTPYSCAVDPRNGNLAVSNFAGGGITANVALYFNQLRSVRLLRNPDAKSYYFLGYDRSGHLWVDGTDLSGAVIVSGCNATSCATIPLSGPSIRFPGFVQWAVGQATWYVADRTCGNVSAQGTCIYPVSASGTMGTAITLDDAAGNLICGLNQAAVTPGKSMVIVGGISTAPCGGASNSVVRWSFPGGGTPTDSQSSPGVPFGGAISTRS